MKNLSDVMRGGGAAGGGIKGEWNCTPVQGADFSVVDTYRASYNPTTKLAQADWSSITSPVVGTPYVAALKTDLNLGGLTLDQVKKISAKLTADNLNNTDVAYAGVLFLPNNSYTAEQAATMLNNLLVNQTPLPNPSVFMVLVCPTINDGVPAVSVTASFATDNAPSGITMSTATSSAPDLSMVSVGDTASMFLSRRLATNPTDGEALHLAATLFDADGTLITASGIDTIYNNPVVPAGMTMYIGLIGISMSQPVIPSVSLVAEVTSGPNTVDLSQPVFTSGGFSYTQGDWDLIFPVPATTLQPISQATFPQGTKKNDQYRVRLNAPYTSATPYGTLVANGSVIIVNNVTPGQEALSVNVDTATLEARIATIDLTGPLAAKDALIAEAGRRGGVMTFFVKAADPSIGDPLTGPGVYDTFELAYQAAIAQPPAIPKVIIMDDRSTNVNYRPSITYRPDAATYYLAGNNIKLSTMTAWQNQSRDPRDFTGSTGNFAPIVSVYGTFDALHFHGGAWQVFNGSSTGDYWNTFCVNGSPSDPVATPSGDHRQLEIGDNTYVMLSPLSFNMNNWDDPTVGFRIGSNSALQLWPDCSSGSTNVNVYSVWGGIWSYDTYHNVPGQMSNFNGEVVVEMGENSTFEIATGIPSGFISTVPFTVKTPVRHRTISFGTMPGCVHLVQGVDKTYVDEKTGAATEIATLAAGRADEVVIIRSMEDFAAAVYSSEGPYSDGEGNTVYDFQGGKTYVLMTTIVLGNMECMLPLGGVIPPRFVGLGPNTGILGMRATGWLATNSNSAFEFENMIVGWSYGKIYYNNSVSSGTRGIFRNCFFGVDSTTAGDLIPDGAGGADLRYIDSRVRLLTNARSLPLPATIENNVLFQRTVFEDATASDLSSNSYPVFNFSEKTVNGRVIFRECEVTSTVTNPSSAKRTLLSCRSPFASGAVTIANSGGITVDRCTKNWNDASYNGNRLIQDSYLTIPNLVVIDETRPEVTVRGKRVIDVYSADDWPKATNAANWVVLPPNTIFRIHGTVEVPATRCYLAIGTEIVGTGKTILDSQLRFGAVGHTATGNDGYLIGCGDDFAVQNLLIINGSAGANKVGLIIQPDHVNAGNGAPTNWYTGRPIIIDDVVFGFSDPFNNSGREAIRILPAVGAGYTPSIELGNVFTDDQPTYTINVSAVAGNNMVRNLTIRNQKGPLPDTPYKRPQVVFGDKYWLGKVTIRDNDLIEPPITITATGVAALTGTNRVTAFNNRGISAAGVYGNALTTYVDGILMSDATLMLAQGNILGAPNSP